MSVCKGWAICSDAVNKSITNARQIISTSHTRNIEIYRPTKVCGFTRKKYCDFTRKSGNSFLLVAVMLHFRANTRLFNSIARTLADYIVSLLEHITDKFALVFMGKLYSMRNFLFSAFLLAFAFVFYTEKRRSRAKKKEARIYFQPTIMLMLFFRLLNIY